MNCSETVIHLNLFIPQSHSGGIYMKIYYLPAGGTVGAGELEVSPIIHKTELRSQTLLYQTLHAKLNENNIQNVLKTVVFHQKYSDMKTPAMCFDFETLRAQPSVLPTRQPF